MSERRGSGLAQRMKAKLEEEERAQARAIAERERRLSRARAARDELLADLRAFADVLEPVASAQQGEALVLRRGDRFLQVEPMGEGDRVRLSFTGSEGEEHRLYREEALGDRWVWAFTRRHRGEDRLPLFDEGLEELLVRALELPRVTAPDPDPIIPRPAAPRTPTPDPFAAFSAPEEPEQPEVPASRPSKRNL